MTDIKIEDWLKLLDEEQQEDNEDDDHILQLKYPHPKEIVEELFSTLNKAGANPTDRSFIQKCLWMFHVSSQIFWWIIIGGYNFCCFLDMAEFLEHIMFIAIVMQVLIKFGVCIIYQKNLVEILKIVFDVFWNVENLITPAKKIYITYNIILKKMIFFYKWLFILSLLVIAFETMYSTPGQPVTKVWSPKSIDFNNYPYGYIFMAGQLLSIAGCVVLTIVPYDSLFIMMTGSAFIQLECLKCTVTNIDCKDQKKAYKTLMKCVEYHNLILSYLKKVEVIYSLSLMSQLSASIFTICIAIYLWTTNENFVFRPFLYAMLSSAQLLVYCFGGQMITDQSASVANATFEGCWWKLPDKSYRGGLIMMIQRSQREVNISAGGVYILSMDLYMKILRACVSFMTLLKNSINAEQ